MKRKTEADAEAARVAEALRRAGGALPVEHLDREMRDSADAPAEPVRRCVRRHDDLFLVVERSALPGADDWSPAELSAYERAGARPDERVVLLDGLSDRPRPPAVVRETLLALWSESPDDDQVRRELARDYPG